MFGGGAAQKKIEELELKLQQAQRDLNTAQGTIGAKANEVAKLKADEKKTKDQLKKQTDDATKLAADKSKLEEDRKKLTADMQAKAQEIQNVQSAAATERQRARQAFDQAKAEAEAAVASREAQLAQLREEKSQLETTQAELEDRKLQLEKNVEMKAKIIQEQEEDSQASKFFLDVSIDGCEFAKPFPYFLTVQLGDEFAPRRTDTSASTQYPQFESSSFLLPFHDENTENQLIVRAYVVVNPEREDSAVKKLGEAIVSLHELGALKAPDRIDPRLAELRQKTIVHNASFLRKTEPRSGAPTDAVSSGNHHVLVGKCMLRIEKKLLKPSEELILTHQRGDGQNDIEKVKDTSLAEELDQGLWLVTPFQHRLRILCHCAKDVVYLQYQEGGSSSSTAPPPRAPDPMSAVDALQDLEDANNGTDTAGAAVRSSSVNVSAPPVKLQVTARLLRYDGTCAFQVPGAEFEVQPPGQFNADIVEHLILNQELVLPLGLNGGGASTTDLRDQRCELTVTLVRNADVREILCVQFFLNVIPAFDPVTVMCCTSGGGSSVSAGGGTSFHAGGAPTSGLLVPGGPIGKFPSGPGLCFTVTREIPLPDIAESFHGIEFRCHGVPTARPLPEMANHALLLVSPDFPTQTQQYSGMPTPRVTIVRYHYDVRRDLSAVLEGYFKDQLATYPRPPRYFMTPVAVSRSRCPQFDGYVLRSAAADRCLQHLSLFLFELNLLRSEPTAPLPDHLVGFACVDASTLCPPEGARDPLHRAYMLDLRLLEDPTRASTLAVDVRIWGRNMRAEAMLAAVGHKQRALSSGYIPDTLPNSPEKPGRSLYAGSPAKMPPALPTAEAQEQEFRLNQDLSIQLMREFNLRASALKTAGEEIVELKKTIQILQNQNAKLNMQLEEELKFNEDVRVNQPLNSELLDSLSTSELAMKLQTAVAKYREEKNKVNDLKTRMESGMREIVKNRGLERKLEELEQAHLEQATLLQKYQKDTKKIELYRETARSQEKVIGKLEKVLESSLEDLHKAQQTQIELERVRSENVQLRQELASLSQKASSLTHAEEDLQTAKKMLGDKQAEHDKLREICEQLERASATTGGGDKQLLQYKIQQLEARVQTSEQVIRENGKKTSKELAALKLEIARKDAKIKAMQQQGVAG
ncbi:unnamed protein product [Amoebophrya sp. A25]|nr:unnamed protein product [Amoebophrya sp. A25]|eukprot:GSA25T00005064001.1